jgi:hypothetical protein
MLTRFVDAFGPRGWNDLTPTLPLRRSSGEEGPRSRWAQRGAPRCTGDARIHHGDAESTAASRSCELGGEEQSCSGERLRRCRCQAPGGRTTARFLGDLRGAEGADGHGCARRRAQRGTLGGCSGRPGRHLSMTVGSAPSSPCEGSGLGDPSQPEGRLEEMAPGPPGAPAPPFFQGPPCRTSVLSVPPWQKDGASHRRPGAPGTESQHLVGSPRARPPRKAQETASR